MADSRAAAVITGSAAFNVSTSDYTYTYSVMNTGMDDLVLVSVRSFSPLGVSGPFAPTGFSLTFDPSQGWANFMEDGSILTSETFAPGTTVGLFSFTSPYGPGAADFVAYDVSGTEFSGLTVAPVPEPGSFLTGSGALVLAALRRRRILS